MTDNTTDLSLMLLEVRAGMKLNQAQFAGELGCTPQFLCDLEKGNRRPSPEFVDKICDYLSRGPKGRKEWHVAAARAHGWKV